MNGPTDAPRPRQTALDETFRGFLRLSHEHQLELARRVNEFLALRAGDAVGDDEQEQKRETLVCIRRAQEHLGLDRPPKVREYAEAAAELELAWSWQRIQRLWGSWLAATNALTGGRVAMSVAASTYSSRYRGRKRAREDYWVALRKWLDTKPANQRVADYDDFARAYNKALPAGLLALPRAATIMGVLDLPWRELLPIARGEKTEDEATHTPRQLRDWSRGPHALVSLSTIARMSGKHYDTVVRLSRRPDFPAPAVEFGRGRAWLLEDIEAYLRGEEVPRYPPNRLRHLYLTAREYADALAVSIQAAQAEDRDVAPAGMVGATLYWLKSEIDDWVARNGHVIAKRRARREQPGTQPRGGGSGLVTTGDMERHFGLSEYAVDKLVAQDGFPEPLFIVGDDRVWSLRQVEAYIVGHPLPAPPSALVAKLVDAAALGEKFVLRAKTVTPSRTKLPPPLLTVGHQHFWHSDEVDAWVAQLPARDRERINKRRADRGLEPL